MVKEQLQKCESKGIAASQRTEAAKRLRHKNTAPTHRSHHFYSVSFWPVALADKG
jgi:hypothetical protein